MKTRILLIASLFISVFGISSQALAQKAKAKTPKRVVFLIGDGMGLAQISGAMSGYQGRNAFERFTYIGLSKTKSADNYVTDSGAGATVFSIGKKAKNGAIGVDSAEKASDGLFEKLKKANWGTGVVATSSVTHATPASFYSHVSSRRMEEQIAEFLLKGNCDIAIGGGQKFFNQRTIDSRNIFEELKPLGFAIKTDSVFEPIDAKKLVYTLAQNGMKTMQEGRGDYLLQATKLAQTNLLKYYGNYFLMVEGSQIDWGGHDNNYEYMKAELLDFNSVLNLVLDAAIKDGETLVIVTADHETGGLSLLENKENPSTFTPNYASKGHSGIMVPVFAFGPGAENFTGIYENTEIYAKLIKLLNLNGND